MALMAKMVDGKLETSTLSSNSISDKESKSSNLNKDAFLQLLVAEMQYQDPLEPTSNTEYISQFATFSQVESLGNMEDTLALQSSYDLVGKEVIMKVTDKNGESNYKSGMVDYVYIEQGKPYLSIDGELYSLDDLDTVIDGEYLDAYNKVMSWAESLGKIPKASLITLDDEKAINELEETYNGMSDYEKSFIASDVKALYEDAVKALKTLKEIADKLSEAIDGDSEEKTEETEKTEEADENPEAS